MLSIVWTWPLAARLTSRIPHDPGDPILNTWILWWNTQALPLTQAWWNAPILVPLPAALALSEHLLGLSVFATPIQFAGAGPLVAYNVSMLLSYALSGFFAYLLALRLTGSVAAAWCAGLAFAFAPYRAGQLAHIQVLTSQWMPAMLLGMHGYVETGQRRWVALFGASWLLQALSNGYYLLFMPALIVPWLAWFVEWRRAPRRGLMLAVTWVLASLPLVPVLLTYYKVQTGLGLARNLADIRQFSATLKSFTYASPLLRFRAPGDGAASAEDWLYPGVTIVALTLAGLVVVIVRRELRASISRRSPLLFYAGAAVLMFAFTLGPGGDPGGPPSVLRPYTWLMWMPGYTGLRVPSRFAMLGELCLAISGSLALVHLARRTGWRIALASFAVAGIVSDGFMEPLPIATPPQRLVLDGTPDSRVIEILVEDARVSVAAMYRAMYHGRPLVNGYTGYLPHHYAILSLGLWRGDTSVLSFFARDKPLVIVVNADADADGGFRRMIEAIPGIEPRGITGAGTVFLLPQQPRSTAPLEGSLLPATVADAGNRRVIAALGAVRTITGIEFALRGRYKDLDGRVLVEVSEDGRQWHEAWLGWTGEHALEAALRDPQRTLVRIPTAPSRGRFLRVYPADAWLVTELGVLGR